MTPFKFADFLEAGKAEALAAATGNRVVSNALDDVLEELTICAETRPPDDMAQVVELLSFANHLTMQAVAPNMVRALRVLATGGPGVDLLIALRALIADADADGDFTRGEVLRNVLASFSRPRLVA